MSWMPLDSLPTKLGWKSTSGLLPIVTTLHMAPIGRHVVRALGGRPDLRVEVQRESYYVVNQLTFTAVLKEQPRSVRNLMKYSARSRPVRSRRAGVWRRGALVQGHGMGHPIAGG